MSIQDHDMKFIESVLNGTYRDEPKPVKPKLPSLKGRKLVIGYKDSEAVELAVDDFIDDLLRGVKNSDLIREEMSEQIYSKIKVGEYMSIEIDLDTGAMTLKAD